MNNGEKNNNSQIKNRSRGGECKEDKFSLNHNDKEILKKYIHDIRNTKTFSRDTLIDINNLPYDDRLKVLLVYNEMMTYYSSLFNDI